LLVVLEALAPAERLALQGFLAPRLSLAQHVEAHPRDNRCQPAGKVPDPACVRATKPQPSFLNRVVGLTPRAEHSISYTLHVGAMGLKSLREPSLLVHSSHLPAGPSHRSARRDYDEKLGRCDTESCHSIGIAASSVPSPRCRFASVSSHSL